MGSSAEAVLGCRVRDCERDRMVRGTKNIMVNSANNVEMEKPSSAAYFVWKLAKAESPAKWTNK